MSTPSVAVVGSGIVGLASAIELSRCYAVTVYHSQDLLETTSASATAIWHVYLVDPHDPTVLRWSTATLKRLLAMTEASQETGVWVIEGVELFRRGEEVVPSWHSIPPMFRMLGRREVATFRGAKWGYRISAPMANMRLHLPWLEKRAGEQGVRFIRRELEGLDEVSAEHDLVVNCTGLGARDLVGDESLRPVRGQYLVLAGGDDAPTTYVGDDEHPDGMAYMIPRQSKICVGGTEEYDNWSLKFEADEDQMIRRAAEFVPWLRDSGRNVEARVVGLRPFREAGVRLEIDQLPSGRVVVHNYGHGGSGFSLSWGCAIDVVASVQGVLTS